MSEINHAPDTAMSVLELFNPSKEGIISFSSKVIKDVEDGNVDPLRVRLICKTLTEIADAIDKGTKANQASEAAKFGDKPFMFHGAELHHTATYTSYDYRHCNDRVYEKLKEANDLSTAKLKDRETLLKALKEKQTMVDEDSGEVYVILPPIKSQTMGLKVSIK